MELKETTSLTLNNTEHTYTYGKLCERRGWSLDDAANDERIQDLLDMNYVSRTKVPSAEKVVLPKSTHRLWSMRLQIFCPELL